MKRFLATVLAAAMVFSLAACGSGSGNGAGGKENIESPTALLSAVWGAFGDEEKFMAMGGGGSETAQIVDGAPGAFDIADPNTVYSMLAMPTDAVAKIDGAASLFNAMMLNNFTAGAFHVSKSGDVESVAKAMKEGITGMQWMCGFPEKYVVAVVDDYVVSAYGLEDFIKVFKARLTEVYKSASIVYEGDVM